MKANSTNNLSHIHHTKVRFSDCDPFQIVWHGNYLLYFEDAREAFCSQHKFSYLDVKKMGFGTPIVSFECKHKHPLKYGDTAIIETTFVNSLAAKLIFSYVIRNQDDQLICTGKTTQVFVDENRELVLNTPDFFKKWKEKHKL
ncbi:acyl-CoA thioesterase [Mesonia maritima]|uniref:Acyl-CoA thioester hydrolase n=1 Tax=Mesonia maritima TaxID=1793873 RepID=A0ABU1K7U1_9FLAO|nr:acyl-CoA thioesterase [Mesonia maritima]MDR6301673.1 acyl-CoA thioester hydrolase [Mesonia maritima]